MARNGIQRLEAKLDNRSSSGPDAPSKAQRTRALEQRLARNADASPEATARTIGRLAASELARDRGPNSRGLRETLESIGPGEEAEALRLLASAAALREQMSAGV